MTTILITQVPVNNPPIGSYNVEVSWRYGTSGSFTLAAASLSVNNDGSVPSPLAITFDENINPSIQVKIVYITCTPSVPFYRTYTAGGINTTTSTSTTTTAVPTTFVAYWGWKGDNTVLTPTQIIASPYSSTFANGAKVIANYMTNSEPQYLWMAEPLSQPAKTKWYGDVLNNGNIGTDQDLFDVPVASGGYRFYITVYQTQNTSTPIEFRVS